LKLLDLIFGKELIQNLDARSAWALLRSERECAY
jgi:hypothetical protein